MDLMKTMLLYMTLVLTSAVGDAPAPTPTPTPEMTPPAIVAPAPQQGDPVAEITAPVQPIQAPTPGPTATPRPTAAPAPDLTPDPSYKTLRPGNRGAEVRKLQERLTELGYMQSEIDGVYGDRTKGAVMRFQKAHGLSRDGIAGRHTLTILYQYDQVIPDPSVVTPTPEVTPTPVPAPTQEPTPQPAAVPAEEPPVQGTQIPVLDPLALPVSAATPVPAVNQAIAPATQAPAATEAPQPTEVPQTTPMPAAPQGGTALAVLADGRILVDEMSLTAEGLLALSAEMDVLIDVGGLAEALEWEYDAPDQGLGWVFELGEELLVINYTLKDGLLDLVSVTYAGEAVELTEAMTGLAGEKLYLSPIWLEAMGAACQWDPQSLTLTIAFN